MKTIAIRELHRNPRAVIQRVLETGEDHEITAYGRSTGVCLVRCEPRPKQWVTGAELMAADFPPMSREDRESWKHDIESAWEKEDLVNPWKRS